MNAFPQNPKAQPTLLCKEHRRGSLLPALAETSLLSKAKFSDVELE